MSNFKKALRTIVLFLLIVIIFSVGIMAVFFSGENFYYQDEKERDELSGTLDFLICGSSHSLRGLKPYILDEELGVNSYNLSNSNATMQSRYEMLHVEMKRNPVDTVVLGVSYNSMIRSRDVKGYESDFYVLSKLDPWNRISYFFSAIEPSEYISIYYNFLNKGFECLDMVAHGTWTSKNKVTEKGYVSYEAMRYEPEESDVIVTEYSDIYDTEILPEEIDEQSEMYLNKITELCQENNVNLIMLSVPMSKTFISKYQNLDSSYEWYVEYAKDNDIKFFDFNLYKGNATLFSDEVDYHDANHLNEIGSDKFSKLFSTVYKKAENGEDVQNLFYDSYEEMKSIIFSE